MGLYSCLAGSTLGKLVSGVREEGLVNYGARTFCSLPMEYQGYARLGLGMGILVTVIFVCGCIEQYQNLPMDSSVASSNLTHHNATMLEPGAGLRETTNLANNTPVLPTLESLHIRNVTHGTFKEFLTKNHLQPPAEGTYHVEKLTAMSDYPGSYQDLSAGMNERTPFGWAVATNVTMESSPTSDGGWVYLLSGDVYMQNHL